MKRCAPSFGVVDGEPVQRIAPPDSGFALLAHDLRGRATRTRSSRR